MKTIIFGGSGYIGSELCKYLVNKKIHVTSYDAIVYSQSINHLKLMDKKFFKFIKDDGSCHKNLEAALENIENVVVLMGLVGDPITKKYPEISHKINIDYIKKVILFSKKSKSVKRLIFISTCSNYGIQDNNKLADENTMLNPLSIYAKQKVEIEKYILSLQGKTDFSATILRFATAFGLSDRMRFDLTINEFVREAYLGNLLEIYDSETWRPYCHVKDFCRIILTCLLEEQKKINYQIFNAGDEENNFTKLMIVNEVKKKIPNFNYKVIDKSFDKRNYKVNFKKIQNILNFKAEYNIEYGILEIINSLKNGKYLNKKLYEDSLGNYEIKSNF